MNEVNESNIEWAVPALANVSRCAAQPELENPHALHDMINTHRCSMVWLQHKDQYRISIGSVCLWYVYKWSFYDPYISLQCLTATGSTGNKISDIFWKTWGKLKQELALAACGSVAQFQTIPEENAKAAAACSNLQQAAAASASCCGCSRWSVLCCKML